MRADDVEIPHPCSIDLRERIAGASAEFHCDHCDRSVHVLSHMSEADAARILARRQRDNLCVAFLRTPDGRVHFKGEALVPANRLAGPRMILRASALALGVAACSPEGGGGGGGGDGGEHFGAVGGPPPHATGIEAEPETELEGTSTGSEATHAQIEEQHMEVLGGAPPAWDEARDVEPLAEQPDAKPDLHVDFERLEQITMKHPPHRALLATKAARHGGLHVIEIEYCVTEEGRLVDAKHVGGDRELARLYIRAASSWRFKPYKAEGQPTRVCTKQHLVLDLDGEEPVSLSVTAGEPPSI